MILRTIKDSRKFFTTIATHLSPFEPVKLHPYVESEGVYYVGAGYWRISPVWSSPEAEEAGEDPIGAALVNPDKTAAQIRTVEQALCILRAGEYREGECAG